MARGAIGHSVEQARRLITDLLEAAKIESGTFTVDRAPTTLDALVEDALGTFRPIAAEKGIAIDTELSDIGLECDRERVVEALSNLLGNAIKFTAPGGRISVRAEHDEREVRLCVADTGQGISPDALGHVFDRFWQAQEARRAGAGLGLSIAKGIVEAHGGRIWAESEPGVGSRFWFALPRAA